MILRTVTVFSWNFAAREWRLDTRRDGRPLVTTWPAVHVVLDNGQPRLVVPPAED